MNKKENVKLKDTVAIQGNTQTPGGHSEFGCKLEDILGLPNQQKRLSRVAELFVKKGILKTDNSELPKMLCCMDDRIKKGDEHISIAGSGILIIKDLIEKGFSGDEIIGYLTPIWHSNNISTILSHQDCGAGGLFYNFLKDYGDTKNNNSIEDMIQKLETIFPGISEISFDDNNILVSGNSDIITALVLKYIAIKGHLEFGHIALSDNSQDIPLHDSRSIVIDLSAYNLTGFFQKADIHPGYFLDASLFLEDITLIEKITEEAIIGKLIAQKEPGICQENKMMVSITIESGNQKQKEIAQKIQNDIYRDIDREFHDLIGKFEIVIFELPKIKRDH